MGTSIIFKNVLLTKFANTQSVQLKYLFFLFLSLILSEPGFGQSVKNDTIKRDSAVLKKELHSQTDSVRDTTTAQFQKALVSSPEVQIKQSIRHKNSRDSLFYLILFILIFLGVIRTVYDKYFSNLTRVFLQSTLRQSQLTDQLMQAKQPSLFLNLFFILTGGLYLALLLKYSYNQTFFSWSVFLFASSGLIVIYTVKYFVLQFVGWLTGFSKEAESYIFIVFLINKIMGLILTPFIILLAFTESNIIGFSFYLSVVIILLLFVIRMIRSRSALKYRLKVNRLHFFLYIIGVELLPILLIHKWALMFISKNL